MEISNQNQKLSFSKNGVQIWVKNDSNDWKAVTTADNPLVRGKSFDIKPQKLKKINESLVEMKGATSSFSWSAQVSLLNQWAVFDIEIKAPNKMILDFKDHLEPELTFQLPTVSVQEEGGHIWDQVVINNPSVSHSDIQQSDFPATYVFDPQLGAELMFYLDWEQLSWVGKQNIIGFLGGKCGLKSVLTKNTVTPTRERFVGFWPENREYLGNIFPKGKHTFRYYISARNCSHKVSHWEALDRLSQSLVQIINKKDVGVLPKHSWREFSVELKKDLLNESVSQIKLDQGKFGLRAYAKLPKFETPNPSNKVELMTQVDLVWPLLLYTKLESDKELSSFNQQLIELLPNFYQPKYRFLANWYPQDQEEKHQDFESWYFLENGLIKFAWISWLMDNHKMKTILESFADELIDLAQAHGYLLPLYYDWRNKKPLTDKKNYPANGLFAYGMLLVYSLTNNKKYLTASENALSVIHQMQLDLLFHEPQQLSFASLASWRLYQKTSDPKYFQMSLDFSNQLLRMTYPYTDKQLLKELGCDSAGMIRSFPSKIYPVLTHNPAFKENVESLLALTPLLKEKTIATRWLKIFAQARYSNFYFFDKFHRSSNPLSIPLEALPALPSSGSAHKGGGVGHALYAAGEVYWMYLMFEAMATTTSEPVCIIYLDLLDLAVKSFPSSQVRNFVIYNPTAKEKSTKVTFNHLADEHYQLTVGSQQTNYTSTELTSGIKLNLKSNQFQYVTLSVVE